MEAKTETESVTPSQTPPSPQPSAKPAAFTEKKWAGKPLFVCNAQHCAFDTFERTQMEQHVKKVHGVTAVTRN